MFSDIIFASIASSYILMDSKLQDLSNGTKNTHIGVRMTKLWSYEVGAKAGKLQQRRAVHLDVATLPNDVATLGVDFGWIFSPF